MNLVLEGHAYRYAVEQCQLVFFPDERPVFFDTLPADATVAAVSKLTYSDNTATASTRIRLNGAVYTGRARTGLTKDPDEHTRDRELSYVVKLSFYRAACRATGRRPPWGALTGIRPAGLMLRMARNGLTLAQANRVLRDRFDVGSHQRALCTSAAETALAFAHTLSPRDVSLYVGIPFCPTRCSYCTFVSHAVEKAGPLLPSFLAALARETAALGAVVRALSLRVVSLYVGGGTPTTLSAQQLDTMLSALYTHFDLTHLRECTVEAGRPDTVTPEKLDVMRRYGAARVSINPQTMQDGILQGIGRPHTAQTVLDAYHMARRAGIPCINMDLIAGLPGDTAQGFFDSLEQVMALRPENITIHTLARKKGSHLAGDPVSGVRSDVVESMLSYAHERLRQENFRCYYLYRQKYMAGQFENTGWAQSGTESLYNVCMMEELHTVLSLGGGGVSKLVDPACGRIERIFNPKYPYEYLSGIEKVLERKQEIVHFYQNKDDIE